MKKFGDTPHLGDGTLCTTCRRAHVIKGKRLDEFIIRCGWMEDGVMHFEVTSCTKYRSFDSVDLDQMESIAWHINVDSKRNKIGFAAPGSDEQENDKRGRAIPWENISSS